MAGITLHLTLVMTNSLRVNQARVRVRSFLLSLVFASRGRRAESGRGPRQVEHSRNKNDKTGFFNLHEIQSFRHTGKIIAILVSLQK